MSCFDDTIIVALNKFQARALDLTCRVTCRCSGRLSSATDRSAFHANLNDFEIRQSTCCKQGDRVTCLLRRHGKLLQESQGLSSDHAKLSRRTEGVDPLLRCCQTRLAQGTAESYKGAQDGMRGEQCSRCGSAGGSCARARSELKPGKT